MSRRPFYKRYGGDFLMGTMDLTLEESGAYSKLLDLMYDRGSPIPDEPRWIAGFLNCSTRRWGQLRESLLAAPNKLVLRGDRLSNPRFERELGLDEAHHSARVEWGRKGGQSRAAREKEARAIAAQAAQPEFPLGDEIGNIGDKPEPAAAPLEGDNSDLSSAFAEFSTSFVGPNSREPEEKPKEINGSGQAHLKHARASHIPESRKREDKSSLSPPSKPKPDPKPAAKSKPRNKAKRARPIPKAWKPKPLPANVQAMVAAWPEKMLEREVERLVSWAKGNGATKVDWDQTLHNWLRKADDDWKRAGARPLGKPSGWNFAERR